MMDEIALTLSILSTVIAVVSVYISQLKRGKIVLPSVRGYRLEPLNFYVENEGYRAIRLSLMVTFMNTGAQTVSINDLRVKMPIPEKGKDLFLQWVDECPELASEQRSFASQPTLGPYGSSSHVYTFVSPFKPEFGQLVKYLEEVCEKEPEKLYAAKIQLRCCKNCWSNLAEIYICPNGRNHIERDFNKINGL